MNRSWLLVCSILALLLFAGFGSQVALAQDTVKFQVNMTIMMEEGWFLPGSGDIVTVAGDINSWSTTADTLKSTGPSDSIYTLTKVLAPGTIHYKFYKTLRGGIDWEHNQPTASTNREFTVAAANQAIPLVWFNDDSVYVTPPQNVPVTFRVNMSVQMLENKFIPDSGDIVRIAGSFDAWGSSTDTLVKGVSDSIYSKTVMLLEGSSVQWKYLKTARAGADWEVNQPTSSTNRELTVPTGGGVLPVAWFSNDSVYRTPVNTTILWHTNMSVYTSLGWFDPVKDNMQVRGGFNGWGGTAMSSNLFDPSVYELSGAYNGANGDVLANKYYMAHDSAGAVALWGPDYATHMDDYNYEHPCETGDGNNNYTVIVAANQGPDIAYYSGINPNGVIPSGDSVNVTFTVNMGPAKRYIDPFVPANDTVKLGFFDRLWRASQWKNQGGQANFPDFLNMAPAAGGGDSVYTVTFKVKGPTHYNIMYYYRYVHAGGTNVDEGGGLGAANPYRSRFVHATSPGVWPTAYSAPSDSWQKSPPMPGETAQFTTGIPGTGTATKPLVYKLYQNYPNPFNPTTTIKFAIPKQSQVSLKVFNILGQEVTSLMNRVLPAGEYVSVFEANRLASGVYFYRLEAGQFTQVGKMLLMK